MAPNNGILTKQSNHSVDENLNNLQRALEAKGVTVLAVVGHSGEAERVGLKMRPTKLVVFVSPKAVHVRGAGIGPELTSRRLTHDSG